MIQNTSGTTVSIGNRKIEIKDIKKIITDCAFDELKSVLDLVPDASLGDLISFVLNLDKKKNQYIWRKQLKESHDSLAVITEPTDCELVSHWNRILDEFTEFKYVQEIGCPIRDTVIHEFDIKSLYLQLCIERQRDRELVIRLIDVKLNLTFLWNIMHTQYQGAFQVAGNNSLELITPEALSWLYGLSQKIYYISVSIEKALDLIEYIMDGTCTDHKKNKWEKKLKKIANFIPITKEEEDLILDFRNKYRTAEFHKLSSIRSMTANDSWVHFEKEQNFLFKIVSQLVIKIGIK